MIAEMSKRKIIVLTIIPMFIVGLYLLLFGVNIPFMDQWAIVPLLMKKQLGLLSLSDLFAQHNEHRPFFPRLIWITLSGFTHYNVNAELWLNFFIVLGTFVFFVDRAVKTWAKLGITVSPLVFPLMSLLVFNLSQRDSWLQGFQTAFFLGAACIIIGLFLLAENPKWTTFFVALLLGVVANYSMANGILYWFIGLVVLLVNAPQNLRVVQVSIWVVCSAISIGLFFMGWTPIGDTNFYYPFAHFFEWLTWILNFLGAPLMTWWFIGWIFGALSIGLLMLILSHVIKNGQWKALTPFFAIFAFILLTSLVISFGRITMGFQQSTAPRYLSMSVWYWMSILTLLPLLNLKSIYQRIFYTLITITLLIHMVAGGWRGYVTFYQTMLPVYQNVRSGQFVTNDMLDRVYINADSVRPLLNFLCKNELSACADVP